jgi:hypothetical protein
MAFDRLKVHLIVDLAAQDAKGFQIVLTPPDRHQFKRRPGTLKPKKVFF